jgi:hypothetical protein
MGSRFHGVLSLLFVFTAVMMVLIYLLSLSVGLGLVYLAIIIIANPLVIYAYCGKCLCREHACSHVFPGKLTRFLPPRKQGSYTIADYAWTGIAFVALLGFPQAWLWHSSILFAVFWLLLIVGLIEILFRVCPRCQNKHCPSGKIAQFKK